MVILDPEMHQLTTFGWLVIYLTGVVFFYLAVSLFMSLYDEDRIAAIFIIPPIWPIIVAIAPVYIVGWLLIRFSRWLYDFGQRL